MNRIRLTFILALALFVASCTHKELCYDHTHTRNIIVQFDWSKAPEAAPRSMSLYLFPENGDKPLRYEFTNKDGGKIRVVAGYYKAICMNSDVRDITIQDKDDFDLFCISTKDVMSVSGLAKNKVSVKTLPKAKSKTEERWVYSPEQIWSGCLDKVEVSEHGQVLTLAPEGHIKNCHVQINNAENLEWISGMSATISSLSGGHHPACKRESEECVTIPFETRYDAKMRTVNGGFTFFGHCPTEQTTHQLIIYSILADESQWYYTYDVTDQIERADDPYNVYITLNELPLPKPVMSGGGFKPTIGGWKEIEINISM